MDDSLDRELAQQATALRRLASALVRDSSVADDVTQQTLQRAIARDTPQLPSGGWLYRTLVNFTHQWRRSEHRRARHEGAAAMPEPVAAPLQILQRREALKNVTDAVLALDEPYQTAILLRYFEDLPPRVIAKRTNSNLTTVKSRLQRGLVMLRQRLDRCQGRDDWRLGLAVAFGLPSAAAVAVSVSTGVMLMSTATKMLAAALLLGIGGYLLFGMRQEPPVQLQGIATSGLPAAVIAATPPATAPTAADRTSAIPAATPMVPWLEHPYSVTLEVRVVDDTGLPVAGRTVHLAPVGGALDSAQAKTDDDGRVLVQWPTRQPQVDVDLQLPNGAIRRVPLQHGRSTALVVVTPPDSERATVTLGVPVLSEVPVLSRFFIDTPGDTTTMQSGLHPFTQFTDPCALPIATEPPNATRSLELDDNRGLLSFTTTLALSSATRALVGQSLYLRDFETPPQPADRGSIAGVVLGEDGQPAAGVPIALFGQGHQPAARANSDDKGAFTFANLAPGEFRVRAGGHEQGLASAPVVVTTGVSPTTLLLRRDACLRGHVVHGDSGKRTFTVEWRADDDSWADAALCADDGSFLLANLPRSRGSLLVWDRDGGSPLPVAFVADVLCDSGDLTVQVDSKHSGTLRVEPRLAADLTIAPSIEVRVRQCASGLINRVTAPKAGTLRLLPGLPAGYYDVELRAEGCGSAEVAQVWIDGTTVDLGVVELPRPGRLDFELPADVHVSQCELFRLAPDFDVRIGLGDQSMLVPQQVPAGDYGIALRDDRGTMHFTRCRVRAGERTLVNTLE